MPAGKFYTKDYTGETVSHNVSWKNRNDPNSMIWVEKTIINETHNGIAHVIGNSTSRQGFDLNLLTGQTGGANGVQSVGQSYGCNLLYEDFSPTFLICINKKICADIALTEYTKDNIVYSNVKNIIDHEGHFYLYPQLFTGNTGSLALRLACADGHKKIYMIGMTTYSMPEDNIYFDRHEAYTAVNTDGANSKFISDITKIFLTYNDVEFFYVTKDPGLMPEEYNWCPNVKEITYNQYYSLASLGAIAR